MRKNIRFELDFRSGIPVYVQIGNQIQAEIVRGALLVGEQLPTVREMANQIGVNFNTVARAYRVLDQARVISTQQGRGTYITQVPSAKGKAQLRNETLNALSKRFITEAAQLGYSKQEIALAVKDKLKWT